MKNKIQLMMIILLVLSVSACSDFLNIMPDGVAVLDNAFARRTEAKKYLFTCYSYIPEDGNPSSDPAFWGDEKWSVENSSMYRFDMQCFNIARGLQNANSPLVDHWNHYYCALRDCNIFLENVVNVPDLPDWEKRQWIAEVKFLKAYYHYCLLRMYGPIPLIRENLPINASQEQVRVFREPVDVCFAYIVQLLDEAKGDLPLSIINPIEELGRITQPTAYALKAKVLVTAASPLFNGNTDQVSLVNSKSADKTPLFNQSWSLEKWEIAAQACKEAVELCDNELGMKLYEYPGSVLYDLSDTIMTQMSLRNAFCEEWNEELIWGNTKNIEVSRHVQACSTPKLDPLYQEGHMNGIQIYCAPLKIGDQFYTDKGVPMEEDKTFDYGGRYDISTAGVNEQLYIHRGSKTANIHFNREPRFYAWIGFDTGVWYGQGKYDDKKPDDLFYVRGRKGQLHGAIGYDYGPVTGYIPKKYVHFQNIFNPGNDNYSMHPYTWPLIRLADIYLLYAEALNEAADIEANRTEAIKYVDKIRKRAGLKGVTESWTKYSTNVGKFRSQVGLRDIIHRERLIELAFEGHRFWDLRRWKEVIDAYRTPVEKWNLEQKEPQSYYQKKVIMNQTFGLKDYFWPISNVNLQVNTNLEQNIGWN